MTGRGRGWGEAASAAQKTNKAVEPAEIGTPSMPPTTIQSDRVAAFTITVPFAQILASMISLVVTGMTNRCSSVPCSRSRITAAPVRISVSIVKLEMSCMTPVNRPPAPYLVDQLPELLA